MDVKVEVDNWAPRGKLFLSLSAQEAIVLCGGAVALEDLWAGEIPAADALLSLARKLHQHTGAGYDPVLLGKKLQDLLSTAIFLLKPVGAEGPQS